MVNTSGDIYFGIGGVSMVVGRVDTMSAPGEPMTCEQLEGALAELDDMMDDNVVLWLEAKVKNKPEVAQKRHEEWREMEDRHRRLERRLRRRRKRGTCPGNPNPRVATIKIGLAEGI